MSSPGKEVRKRVKQGEAKLNTEKNDDDDIKEQVNPSSTASKTSDGTATPDQKFQFPNAQTSKLKKTKFSSRSSNRKKISLGRNIYDFCIWHCFVFLSQS